MVYNHSLNLHSYSTLSMFPKLLAGRSCHAHALSKCENSLHQVPKPGTALRPVCNEGQWSLELSECHAVLPVTDSESEQRRSNARLGAESWATAVGSASRSPPPPPNHHHHHTLSWHCVWHPHPHCVGHTHCGTHTFRRNSSPDLNRYKRNVLVANVARISGFVASDHSLNVHSLKAF